MGHEICVGPEIVVTEIVRRHPGEIRVSQIVTSEAKMGPDHTGNHVTHGLIVGAEIK